MIWNARSTNNVTRVLHYLEENWHSPRKYKYKTSPPCFDQHHYGNPNSNLLQDYIWNLSICVNVFGHIHPSFRIHEGQINARRFENCMQHTRIRLVWEKFANTTAQSLELANTCKSAQSRNISNSTSTCGIIQCDKWRKT